MTFRIFTSITSAQAAEAFTFFLQLKKVNKENRRQIPRLPTYVSLMRNKELATLQTTLFLSINFNMRVPKLRNQSRKPGTST